MSINATITPIDIAITGMDNTLTQASPVNPGYFEIFYALNQTPPEEWYGYFNSCFYKQILIVNNNSINNNNIIINNNVIINKKDKTFLRICAEKVNCTEAFLRPIVNEIVSKTNNKYDAWKIAEDQKILDLASAAETADEDILDINSNFYGKS